ncbi:Isochorismatase-like protein [Cladochytrium replicatum]|nr:Isochorismatase-like protein [Cladochytrium replicatum]
MAATTSPPPSIDPKKTALIVVDVQNDFMPGGALGVYMGDVAKYLLTTFKSDKATKEEKEKAFLGLQKIISGYTSNVANVIQEAKRAGILIVTTQDWHPLEHPSFEKKGGIWPDHCVQNTKGADFPAGLLDDASIVDLKVLKGMSDIGNGYSGFGEKTGTSIEVLDAFPSLGVELASNDIETLLVCGVATEYCVKSTAIDGAALTQAKLARLQKHVQHLKEKYFSAGSNKSHVADLTVAEQLQARSELVAKDAEAPKTNGAASDKPVFRRVIVVDDLVHPVTPEGGDTCKKSELGANRVELLGWEKIKPLFTTR